MVLFMFNQFEIGFVKRGGWRQGTDSGSVSAETDPLPGRAVGFSLFLVGRDEKGPIGVGAIVARPR